MVAGLWDMDALREKDTSGGRAGLWDSKRIELEAWEREQAEELRAR